MEAQDRRVFLNRSWKALAGLFALEAAWGSWDMIRPSRAGAFGGIVKAGLPSEFAEGSVRYFPNGRFYVANYGGKLEALYQKCPHLGCRVPFCETSKQFECPCHGSAYNIKGEYLRGPAPRGMDRFPLRVEGNQVLVDTGDLIEGPAQGVITGPAEPAGAPCNGVYPEPVEDEPPAKEERNDDGHAEPDDGHKGDEAPHDEEPHDREPHDEEPHDEVPVSPSPSPADMGGMDMSGMDHTGMDMDGGDHP